MQKNVVWGGLKFIGDKMKLYEKIRLEIIEFQTEDIVMASPGGIEYGKDDDDNDLGWGA